MPQTLWIIIAFIIVLVLIGAAAWLVRRFGSGGIGSNASRGRMPRLAVIDAAAVDGRRKLVLVRRDNVEHLLMIGGPTDVVVEPNIVRSTSQRDQAPQRGPVGTELPTPARLSPDVWPETELAPAEPLDQEIGHHTSMAPIAVGEGVDSYEAMVEAHGNLVRRECLVVDPVANVIEHHADVVGDAMGFNPDIPLCQAVSARPIPHVAEHTLVKRCRKILRQQILVSLPARTGPYSAFDNVSLLGLVEVAAMRNPGLLEPELLFRFQGCCIVGFLEEISHGQPTGRGL